VGQVADQLAIAIRQAQLDEQVHRHAADLEETVAERTREILALRERAEQAAVIEERQRLARELHDAVTQCLYSATLLSETGHQAAMENDLDVARGCLARLIDISQQALKEMRLLIYELRPEALESVGLLGAIERRLDAVESRAGIESHLVADGRPPLTILQEEAAYRIVIEALNNALKHANAACVTVCIQSGEGQTHISIADNGKGFVPERAAIAGGMGLNSMKERAERLGGRLDILSVLGQGTTVTLGVPSHEPTAPPDHAKPGATV